LPCFFMPKTCLHRLLYVIVKHEETCRHPRRKASGFPAIPDAQHGKRIPKHLEIKSSTILPYTLITNSKMNVRTKTIKPFILPFGSNEGFQL
ncbi:hypothetical protein DXT76_12550, partial [Halobacillus trueperi]